MIQRGSYTDGTIVPGSARRSSRLGSELTECRPPICLSAIPPERCGKIANCRPGIACARLLGGRQASPWRGRRLPQILHAPSPLSPLHLAAFLSLLPPPSSTDSNPARGDPSLSPLAAMLKRRRRASLSPPEGRGAGGPGCVSSPTAACPALPIHLTGA